MTVGRGTASNAITLSNKSRAAPSIDTASKGSTATQQSSTAASDPVVNLKRQQVEELRKWQRKLRDLVMGYIAAREVVGSSLGLKEAIDDGLWELQSGPAPTRETMTKIGTGLGSLKDHSGAGALHDLGREFEGLVTDLVRVVDEASATLEPLMRPGPRNHEQGLSTSADAVGVAHDRASQIARKCRESSVLLMESIEGSLKVIFDRIEVTSGAARAEQVSTDTMDARGRKSTVEQSQARQGSLRSAQPDATDDEMADLRGNDLPFRPIRILFLAANPKGTRQLDLAEEVRAIDESLQAAEFRDLFEIRQQWAVRVADLQKALLRHKPDIVHFSGHGTRTSQIVLEGPDGAPVPVPTAALGRLFHVLQDNIKCVVLNACYSAEQAEAIAEHIDCVVGMTTAVGDQAAIRFAAAFYQGLGWGRSIATAFDLGTTEIDLESLADADVPTLLAKRINALEFFFVEVD